MAENKKDVSIWFWMFALFIMAIPCVGVVMVVVWAFWGDNETRKNYFRALIVWFVIVTLLLFALASLGTLPDLWAQIDEIMKGVRRWKR